MEAGYFKPGYHHGGLTGELPVVVSLSFCRGDVYDGAEQAVMVEPGHLPALPAPPIQGLARRAMNHSGLYIALDHFGQSVVVATALAVY